MEQSCPSRFESNSNGGTRADGISGATESRFWAPRFLAPSSSFHEKLLKESAAFVEENAGGDLALMVERRMLQNVEESARASALRVRCSENDASQSGVHDRSCAHRAGLLGHEKITVREPPISHGIFSLGNGKHFSMRSGVFQRFDLIAGPRNNPSFASDYRTDWNLLGEVGFLGLSERFGHEIGVTLKIDNRFFHVVFYRLSRRSVTSYHFFPC